MSGTTFKSEFPGWYITFQAAVLTQLPRPDQFDQVAAESWTNNREGLKGALLVALTRSSTAGILYEGVEDIGLTTRCWNALRNADINTVADLVTTGQSELLRKRNIYYKSLKEINGILHALDLCLGMKIQDGQLFRPNGLVVSGFSVPSHPRLQD